MSQLELFERPDTPPQGLLYRPEFITAAEEVALADRMPDLAFKPFAFRGFEGRRQTIAYGWRYDYGARRALPADPIPDWLLPLRTRAADFAGLEEAALEQVLINQYEPGAPIGWHRDRPLYEDVIGVSLLSPCPFRLRRERPDGGFDRRTLIVEPRSVYLLRGEARNVWEHSIPPAEALRYSITFRSRR